MKTKSEYGEDLYKNYILWKCYEGKLKKDYAHKIKVADLHLRAADK